MSDAMFQPAPPKKSHTVRNVLLVLTLVFVLFVGGCMALLGGVANEIDKSVKSSAAKDAEPGGPDNPLTIKAGEAFDVSDFRYQAGWTIGADAFGYVDVKKLRVENARGEKDGALVEIKVWRGNEVLALADCSTEPIADGTMTALTCSSGDKLPKNYDRVTINDTF